MHFEFENFRLPDELIAITLLLYCLLHEHQLVVLLDYVVCLTPVKGLEHEADFIVSLIIAYSGEVEQ